MSIKKIFIVCTVAAIYFTLNFTFLSYEGYTSMEDYIESTKDEFSYEIEEIIGANFVKSYGGKVIRANLIKNKSTTKLIEKIKNLK